MTRRKQDKYLFSHEAENVIERGNPLYTTIKGKWNELYFKNNHPIVLELACGKGEYSIGLATEFQNLNFIGIDLKGDRLARGSKIALEAGLSNVAFLRTGIRYLDEFFMDNEVSAIWLIHPDPHDRERDEKKRLTHATYLAQYTRYIANGGLFHVKTDSQALFEYSLQAFSNSSSGFEVLDHTTDLYSSDLYEAHRGITTHYERVFVQKGYSIKYLKAINKKGESLGTPAITG